MSDKAVFLKERPYEYFITNYTVFEVKGIELIQ